MGLSTDVSPGLCFNSHKSQGLAGAGRGLIIQNPYGIQPTCYQLTWKKIPLHKQAWPPSKRVMKIAHSALIGAMEFLWVDLCLLLSPFTAPTEGKWPKKANFSWFESGRGPMQMEGQDLPSGWTPLAGQSTAKNIQVGLMDTETWEGTRRAHFPHCCVSQVWFRHIIYKYILLYSLCINVYVSL